VLAAQKVVKDGHALGLLLLAVQVHHRDARPELAEALKEEADLKGEQTKPVVRGR